MIGPRHIAFEPRRPPASVSILPSNYQSTPTLTRREIQIVNQGIKFLREQAKIKANLEIVEVNRGLAETSYGHVYLQFQDGDEYWLEIGSYSSFSLATGRVIIASHLVPFTERQESTS